MSIDINRSIREKKKNYSLPYAFVCSVKETPKKGKRVKARRKGKDARHGQCLEDQSVAHITLPKYVDGGAASRVQVGTLQLSVRHCRPRWPVTALPKAAKTALLSAS